MYLYHTHKPTFAHLYKKKKILKAAQEKDIEEKDKSYKQTSHEKKKKKKLVDHKVTSLEY